MAYKSVPTTFYDNGVTSSYDVSLLDANFTYVSGKTVSVKDYGAVGDGITDDTVAIQAAVTGAAGGALYFPPGSYLITAAINILKSLYIWARPFSVTIYIGTQNQNGFVIGDGTAGTRALVNSTYIDGLQFAPKAGLAACASGATIFLNYCAYARIRNISLVGSLSGTQTLWNGIYGFQVIESTIDRPLVNGFRNNGIRMVGSATVALNTTDNRIDFAEVVNCLGDEIYCGDYTAAITITQPILYNFSAWGIKLDCTAATGVGFNYFIICPDIEASSTTSALGAIYFKQAVGGQVHGGWCGGNGGVQVDSTASAIRFDSLINQGLVPYTISGVACSINGGTISGDGVSTTTGVAIAATATDTAIVGARIQQFTTAGIAFTGNPARCVVLGTEFKSNGTNITGTPSDINTTVAPVGSTTPVPTSGTGTFTTVSATLNWSKPDDRVSVDGTVTITTNGTAASYISVPLPFTPAISTSGTGFLQNNGKSCSVIFSAGASAALIRLYDGTYPGADGVVIQFSGSYRV